MFEESMEKYKDKIELAVYGYESKEEKDLAIKGLDKMIVKVE